MALSPVVSDAINRAAAETGLDPNFLAGVVAIESGGNPNSKTGGYAGLFQLDNAGFARFGGTGSIYDPYQNALAGARSIANDIAQFTALNGRAPTPTEAYLSHQQGVGGISSHLANPDQPAWVSMWQTAEGQRKGQAWAQAAVWGNIPDDMKGRFGNVNNVTSRDFVSLWGAKAAAFGIDPAARAGAPAAPSVNAFAPPSTANPFSAYPTRDAFAPAPVGGNVTALNTVNQAGSRAGPAYGSGGPSMWSAIPAIAGNVGGALADFGGKYASGIADYAKSNISANPLGALAFANQVGINPFSGEVMPGTLANAVQRSGEDLADLGPGLANAGNTVVNAFAPLGDWASTMFGGPAQATAPAAVYSANTAPDAGRATYGGTPTFGDGLDELTMQANAGAMPAADPWAALEKAELAATFSGLPEAASRASAAGMFDPTPMGKQAMAFAAPTGAGKAPASLLSPTPINPAFGMSFKGAPAAPPPAAPVVPAVAAVPSWVAPGAAYTPAAFAPGGAIPASGGSAFAYSVNPATNQTTWDMGNGTFMNVPTDTGGMSYSDYAAATGDGGGLGAGNTVLCTYFMRKGWLSKRLWLADTRFSMGLPAEVREGYWAWACPAVEAMRKGGVRGRVLERILHPVVSRWAKYAAYRMGVVETCPPSGAVIHLIGTTLSRAIGRAKLRKVERHAV